MNAFSLQVLPHADLIKELDSQNRRDLERLTTPAEDLRLTVRTRPETAETECHAHDYWEVFVVFPKQILCSKRIDVIPPGLRHAAMRSTPQYDSTAFNISRGSLHFAGLSPVFTNTGDFHFLQPILLHLTLLYKYATTLGEAAQPWLDAHAPLLLRELVALFLEMHHENLGTYTKGITNPAAASICMAEHFAEPLTSLSDMAASLGLHSASMSRFFRREYGMSAKRFQILRRLQYACDLLAEGRISIAEVARLVGWRNAQYFSTVFRENTGMTPREFARKRTDGSLNGYPAGIQTPLPKMS